MIQRLEEKEVDFDDENDSSYIRLQRYYLLYVCYFNCFSACQKQN
jgi:hypothetical protein